MPSRPSSPVTGAPSEADSSRKSVTIKFGTDGWRGIIADDFTHENVRKVAYAIARYVVRAENPERGVLVGYDNRFASERFARTAAETLTLAGIPVWLAEHSCPLPPFRCLSASAAPRAASSSAPATIP